MQPEGVTEEQWSSILEGLALGRYSLVLGAGASIGSMNSRGEPLPTGAQLAEHLAINYSLPATDGLSLRQTYDLCDQLARARSLTRPAEFLAGKFVGCSVPDWYEVLVQVPWRMIWTLNIDDVLENAYQDRFSGPSRQTLRLSSWGDRWLEQQNPGEVSAIHLHGRASSRDLIFGTLEYLGADNAGGVAHRVFRDQWQSEIPRILIGASLEDELDIAIPLADASSVWSEYPSISIRPTFSEIERLRLELQGIVPIEITAEGFFRAAFEEWPAVLNRVQQMAPSEYRGMSPTQMAFAKDFVLPSMKVDRLHDFFAGDEPSWRDIIQGFDAPRVLHDLSIHPADVFPARGLRVIVFHGELSGASTAELRFLKECTEAGSPHLEHRGEFSIQANVIHGMAKHGFRKILRVPDLDDFPEAVGRLRSLCDQSGVPVVLVSSMRTHRIRALASVLQGSLVAVRVPDRLTPQEIDSVLDVLKTHNRSNLLLGMDRDEMRRFIARDHRGDLIDSLAAISRGRSFAARYALALQEVVDPEMLSVLRVILVCAELGFDLSIGLAIRVTGLPPARLGEYLLSETLSRLLVVGRGVVGARHKGLAARASTDALSVEDRFDIMHDLAIALSPYISPVSITLRSREARICAGLMDARRVVRSLGPVRAADWYQSLEPEFSWNSRFWEQRALAELISDHPRYEMAEAWAREAVERHRDPFSLNTLATVLLRRSTSGALEEDLFFEGLEFADEARNALGDREDEHPFVTALTYLSRARQVAGPYPDLARRLDVLFAKWNRDAKDSAVWRVVESRRLLERAIEGYLLAVAAVPG